jgi:hypothetical protein
MGVTFWGNFASCILLVPFHWHGMCYAHQFSREGSLCKNRALDVLRRQRTAHTFASELGRLLPSRSRLMIASSEDSTMDAR